MILFLNGIKVKVSHFFVEEKRFYSNCYTFSRVLTYYTYHSLFICYIYIYIKSNAIIIILLNPSQTYHFNPKICSFLSSCSRKTYQSLMSTFVHINTSNNGIIIIFVKMNTYTYNDRLSLILQPTFLN